MNIDHEFVGVLLDELLNTLTVQLPVGSLQVADRYDSMFVELRDNFLTKLVVLGFVSLPDRSFQWLLEKLDEAACGLRDVCIDYIIFELGGELVQIHIDPKCVLAQLRHIDRGDMKCAGNSHRLLAPATHQSIEFGMG